MRSAVNISLRIALERKKDGEKMKNNRSFIRRWLKREWSVSISRLSFALEDTPHPAISRTRFRGRGSRVTKTEISGRSSERIRESWNFQSAARSTQFVFNRSGRENRGTRILDTRIPVRNPRSERSRVRPKKRGKKEERKMRDDRDG